MSASTAARNRNFGAPPRLLQAFLALAGGSALFLVLLLGLVFGYGMVYYGEIYPGISVAGVDLSGLTPEQATRLLSERLNYPQSGKVVFQEGNKVWAATPAELGLQLDPQTSALAAYSYGRQGGLPSQVGARFRAWYTGKDMAPLLVYDERAARRYLTRIATEINKPTVEASLAIKGTQVDVRPGQVGRSVDVGATLAPLSRQLRSLSDGILQVSVVETSPAILDASQQAEIARKILSAPLTLTLPNPGEGDPGPWTFSPEQLAAMLTIERQQTEKGAAYQVGLDTKDLQAFLQNLAPKLARSPQDSRFIFNDQTKQLEVIQHGIIGRSLDLDSTLKAINTKLPEGEHNIPVALKITPPAIADDAKAADLGITGLVSEQTTYFYGSAASRIQNITTAASRFHGVMVPPGAVFSMAQVLGDVSLDNGYAEALIIYGNRTIQGVGGGVCQVSTTLFRTVFFGGYPVVERNPHAYRVGYYEQGPNGGDNTRMAGMDATVFVPEVDFKFKNDTPYWLLMETYPTKTSLTWKFYSTSDGRDVQWDTTGLQNVVDPPDPVYQENPKLSKGQIKQVDWAVRGADVSISRTVTKGGNVYLQDTFATHYIPWRAVYEYGPGTEGIPESNNGN